jgi:glycosyltransferase involved in cell wall biosynthesis
MSTADPDLRVRLESHLPRSLPVGRPTAVFLFGHCFHRQLAVGELELLVDGEAITPDAQAMPRRDLTEWLTQTGEDPERRSYRSGFWATVTLPGLPGRGVIGLGARLTVAGQRVTVPLGEVLVVAPDAGAAAEATIAVCIASYEPDAELFAVQIESLRAQTDRDWVCVISDGGSSEETLARMRATLGDDQRFRLEPARRRLGPYENFERALRLAPPDAELLASCDQDDRWYPGKLATLRGAIGDAAMVFSDQRLVAPDGRVLRASLWERRRRDHANLASLLVANAVPGAAMLMRREVVAAALPFPPAPGVPYHDHWLALVALAHGRIAYVDRPLYDYVQHGAAVMGDLVGGRSAAGGQRATGGQGPRGWRSAYFGGYVPRVVFARTLLARYEPQLTPRKRRALRWFAAAERNPLAFMWLATRPLRRFIGRDETLSGEAALAAGVLWRWLLPLAVAGGDADTRAPDASFPDPPEFEQRRLRRWRTVG